ncbi:MAG: U32 family peptidase [Bacilli bacterium]|nr:U32 family peptidase [Bacilli bacterium]
MKKVELLAPAGDIEKLKFAYLYGADAVYIGGKNYSMRANAKNFSNEEIKEAACIAHSLGKKLYVTVNITFHNEDYPGLLAYLKELEKAKVDAIIVSDMAVVDLVKEENINLPLHISTQMSNANSESVSFLKDQGVERVVLARECSKENIKEIIEKTGVEIECFLHGAMCSSYSGRCVLSNYFTKRDANRGGCAQICRWCFELDKDEEKISKETEFTMSSKDLSLINSLEEMIHLGITSLKVEGRMRSNYYIATVISTYREAIDHIYENTYNETLQEYYQKVLNRVANRESTDQFFNTFPGVEAQYYLGRQEVSNQDFLGIVLDYDKKEKLVTLTQRNYFQPGDEVELFGPNIQAFSFKVPKIYNEEMKEVEVARHPQEIIKFYLDKEVYPNDMMRIKIK